MTPYEKFKMQYLPEKYKKEQYEIWSKNFQSKMDEIETILKQIRKVEHSETSKRLMTMLENTGKIYGKKY
jgi:hypothetical protein